MPIEAIDNQADQNEPEDIRELLEENLKLTKEIRDMTKYIKSYIIWSQIFGVIKLIIILVPIILGIIYLPPIIGGFYRQYLDLLENPLGGSVNPNELRMDPFPNSVKGLID